MPPISFLRGVRSCHTRCFHACSVSSLPNKSLVLSHRSSWVEGSLILLTLMGLRITINTPSFVPPHWCSLAVKLECLQRRINKSKETSAGTQPPCHLVPGARGPAIHSRTGEAAWHVLVCPLHLHQHKLTVI